MSNQVATLQVTDALAGKHNEELNIACAELEGWRKEYISGNGMDCDVWIHPNGKDCKEIEWFPNYVSRDGALQRVVALLLVLKPEMFVATKAL